MASSGTTSTKTRFTGAQLIVHLLERQGITTVAGIPGGTVLPLYDALSQSTQIRHVLARAGGRLYRSGHGAYPGQTGGLYGL